jgi:transposase
MPKTIINKNLSDKAKLALLNLKQNGVIANRLRAIISAHKHGVNKVSDVLDIDRTSIFRWAKILDNKGFDSLKNSAKHKDGIKLKIYHKENIKKWITNNPNITRQEVVQKLKDEFDLKISISTARRAMKSCGFSYITPRQNHYKQDKDDGVKFKKNSN